MCLLSILLFAVSKFDCSESSLTPESFLNRFGLPMPQPPRSSYYYGPPPAESAYGTDPMGTIGTHYPREVIRVERDYESGELCQYERSSLSPLER